NESVFPAAVVRGLLVVQNGLTGTSVRRKIRASVAGKASQTIRFQVEDAEIGKLFATVSDLRTQDLFGLVSYPVSHIAAAELLVPPPDVSAEVLMMEALETTGESVRYSEKEKGLDVSELFDVREYLPGDDVRAIHWKLSAKQEEPILREFSQPLNYSVILLVELAAASADALQSCVTYAANLSKGLLEAGVLHTMVWYDRSTDEFVDYNITSMEEQALAELRLVSSSYHETADASLNRFLETGRLDPTATLVYLTTSLESDLILRATREMPVRVELVGERGADNELSGFPVSKLPARYQEVETLSLTV
ncbi:MAG: DUF58 domain-containing protein, partial [Clostridia bacterium]|nr:DUF58 domain-containing protein [Clostridia bacterium]